MKDEKWDISYLEGGGPVGVKSNSERIEQNLLI